MIFSLAIYFLKYIFASLLKTQTNLKTDLTVFKFFFSYIFYQVNILIGKYQNVHKPVAIVQKQSIISIKRSYKG